MFVSSPKLFADCYALHRLLAPRHPPYALDYLNTIMQTLESALQRAPSLDTASTTIPMQIVKDDSTSRGPGAARPPHRPRAAGVDRSLRNRQQSKRFRRSPAIERGRSARSGSIKEVIQPQVPLRLPCYDFTPIIDQTVGVSLPWGWVNDFGSDQLSWCDGRCVQGPGTYSPRHSDPRLLAIPTSCSRVADCNPN